MRFFSFLAVCFLSGIFSLSAAEIRNSGFENGRKSFEGVGWWWFSTSETCDFDSEVFHSGKRSIRLSVNDNLRSLSNQHWNRAALLKTPVIGAKPDTVYTVRGFIRTDMKEGSAGLAVLSTRKKMTLAERVPVKFLPVRKSCGWTELSYTFKTPKNLTGLTLMAAVENFNGRAWFDDFQIQEGMDLPAVPNARSFDQALKLDYFVLIGPQAGQRIPPQNDTEIRMISDGGVLRIRGFCREKNMAGIVCRATGRDGRVWEDDSIEIFLDAQRSRSSYYQFIINANGAFFDSQSGEKLWSPEKISCSAEKQKDGWCFSLDIPYTVIGYGSVEASLPDKQMSLAVFRNRNNRSGKERSSWQLWNTKGNFGNPAKFQPLVVGSSTPGRTYNFAFRGSDEILSRPPLAWQIRDPLYEELMTDEPMHPGKGGIGYIDTSRMLIPNRGATAFALQHGVKYHYDELAALGKRLRLTFPSQATRSGGIDPTGQSLYCRLQKKYGLKISSNPYVQFGGAHYAYASRPDAPMFKHFAGAFFYPDQRVQESFARYVKTLLSRHKDQLEELVMGHEGRFLYFSREYDHIRNAYMKDDPGAWKAFEDQARKEYGAGKTGFPKSYASATPLERLVYQSFVLTEYNKGMKKLTAELRKIKPGIRLISELDPDGIKPYLYEQTAGIYDYMSQQMPWGHGASRQSVAFHCKVLNDLARTPSRGGPHIEHYFVSLTPEETNEVLSSVFRVGGEALQLWLIDWFGKASGDYYGAPERMHEIINVFERYGKMRRLKFPKADTGILYINASQLARSWATTGGVGGGHEEAFTALGPAVGSWFHFVSDTQFELKQRNPADYKVLYDTGSQYISQENYRRLEEYVRAGGTLVISDPTAFCFGTDGVRRDTSGLFGVRVTEKKRIADSVRLQRLPEFPRLGALSSLRSGGGRELEILPETRLLGIYADGSPAITVRKNGKGRVIVFAANPFTADSYGSNNLRVFLSALQQDLGCAVGQPIWRFRFPMAETAYVRPIPPKMECLTGNSWYWSQDMPVEGPNAKMKIRCSYSTAPDLIPDTPECGKLFNRGASMSAKPLRIWDKHLDPWIVAWKAGDERVISLKFSRKASVREVRLWAHGDIPEFEIGCRQGGAYRKLAVAASPARDELDVREIHIPVPAVNTDQLEIRMGRRNRGNIYLGELEVWGNM